MSTTTTPYVPAQRAAGDRDLDTPAATVDLYARQADELARLVEDARRWEQRRWAQISAQCCETRRPLAGRLEQLRAELDRDHRRRLKLLDTLADQLGEQNGELDAVAAALAGELQLPTPDDGALR